MRLFRNTQATATDNAWTCIYGDHPIPVGELYISVCYSRERYDGRVVDVDEQAALLFACMRHAPSEGAVIQALRSAGIPVEG